LNKSFAGQMLVHKSGFDTQFTKLRLWLGNNFKKLIFAAPEGV